MSVSYTGDGNTTEFKRNGMSAELEISSRSVLAERDVRRVGYKFKKCFSGTGCPQSWKIDQELSY